MKRFRKGIILLVAISALGFVTQTAMAGTMGDDGFYVAVGGSNARVDTGDFDDSDTAATVRVGYMFNSIVGLEGGYFELGDFSDSVDELQELVEDALGNRGDVDLDLDAFSLAVVLNAPLTLFDLYGKVGVLAVDAELKANTPFGRFGRSESAAGPLLALGGELDLGLVNIFAEVSRINIDEDEVDDLDIASIGVKFEF